MAKSRKPFPTCVGFIVRRSLRDVAASGTSTSCVSTPVNSQRLDKPPAGGVLAYLQRCRAEKETAAPWENLFERAVDATEETLRVVLTTDITFVMKHFCPERERDWRAVQRLGALHPSASRSEA